MYRLVRPFIVSGILVISMLAGNVFAGSITNGDAKNIFAHTMNRKAKFCDVIPLANEETILCAYEKAAEIENDVVIAKLKQFAGVWQLTSETIIEKESEGQEPQNDFEIIPLGKTKALYFSRLMIHRGTAFNGTGEVQFILYVPELDQYITLIYSGRWKGEKIDGSFDNLKELKAAAPNTLKILETKAMASPFIYHPTTKDYDLSRIENLDKAWVQANPDIYDKNNDYWNDIKFVYYKHNLFKSHSCPDCGTERVKNKFYTIQVSFAGPVLGYDKKTRKYFTIWIPAGMGEGGGWGARTYTIKLKDENVLVLENSFESIEIRLDNKQYRRTLKH